MPAGAKQCPECYSDEETGWSETAYVSTLDLPAGYSGDDDFDYSEYAEKERGHERKFSEKPGIKKWWPYVAGVVVLVSIFGAVTSTPPPPDVDIDPGAAHQHVRQMADKIIKELEQKNAKQE